MAKLRRITELLRDRCKFIYEPRCEKTGCYFLHMRKQRRRSASR